MPRVSESHLAARRQQILDAAEICFARNGFHATTMRDVIAEVGLSAGAVYRYFTGKSDLVAAIANSRSEEIVRQIGPLIAADQPLAEAMTSAVEMVDTRLSPDGPVRLALQVWAESLRDEQIAGIVRGVYDRFREHFVRMADRAVRTGQLAPGSDPDAVGAALLSLLIGYVLQRVLTGSPGTASYVAGLHALLDSCGSPANTR